MEEIFLISFKLLPIELNFNSLGREAIILINQPGLCVLQKILPEEKAVNEGGSTYFKPFSLSFHTSFILLFTRKADMNEQCVETPCFLTRDVPFSAPLQYPACCRVAAMPSASEGERRGGVLSASPAFQGIPVKKTCDSSCRMTQALVVFLESSHNQFNVSDPKANVSFCLRHHQQFSKRFGFGSMCLARDAES